MRAIPADQALPPWTPRDHAKAEVNGRFVRLAVAIGRCLSLLFGGAGGIVLLQFTDELARFGQHTLGFSGHGDR